MKRKNNNERLNKMTEGITTNHNNKLLNKKMEEITINV